MRELRTPVHTDGFMLLYDAERALKRRATEAGPDRRRIAMHGGTAAKWDSGQVGQRPSGTAAKWDSGHAGWSLEQTCRDSDRDVRPRVAATGGARGNAGMAAWADCAPRALTGDRPRTILHRDD